MIPRLTTKTVVGQRSYNFGFDYLAKDFVKVEVDGKLLEYDKDYTVNGRTVEFVVTPTEEKTLLIYRKTSTLPILEWQDGSIMRASDMNIQQRQTQHLSEELAFSSAEAIKTYETIIESTSEVKENTKEVQKNTELVIGKASEVEEKAKEVSLNTQKSQQNTSTVEALAQLNDKYYSDTLALKNTIILKSDEVRQNTDKVALLKKKTQELFDETQRMASKVQQAVGGDYYTKTEVNQKIATEATEALKSLVGTAPRSLDTLQELATAMGNDPNFATTVTALIGTKASLEQVYPVGSIYMSAISTSPSVLFGFGTWEAIEGGRVLLASGNGYVAGTTGGSSTHTIKIEELPRHNHGGTVTEAGAHNHVATIGNAGEHIHNVNAKMRLGNGGGGSVLGIQGYSTEKHQLKDGLIDIQKAGSHTHDIQLNNNGIHTHGITSQGEGRAHNIMQPYLVVYIWKRTA